MNNLRKIGLSALAGSLATFSVNAADFSVSGAASISFDDTNRGKADKGNKFYMGDSLKFNASGETEGGCSGDAGAWNRRIPPLARRPRTEGGFRPRLHGGSRRDIRRVSDRYW